MSLFLELMEEGGLKWSGFSQGGGDGGIEILFGGRFAAFNMLVRMQLGSIPTTACPPKQYLYLNNVDKLNVIFNVWYEYIWQILIWAAGVLTDWKWQYLVPLLSPDPYRRAVWDEFQRPGTYLPYLFKLPSDPQQCLFYGSCLIKLVFIHLSI